MKNAGWDFESGGWPLKCSGMVQVSHRPYGIFASQGPVHVALCAADGMAMAATNGEQLDVVVDGPPEVCILSVVVVCWWR